MIAGLYTLSLKCDNPVCPDRRYEKQFEGKRGYSQARMNAVRAGWKISKKKALCPECKSKGIRLRDITPFGPVVCGKCNTLATKTNEFESCSRDGMHDFRQLSIQNLVRLNMAADYRSDGDEAEALYYEGLIKASKVKGFGKDEVTTL